ncbi:hypothetical protein B0H14DRAFT_2719297 [Mycena olivaceomarginata]|nr:hypothetical protein B0H14DRAFT_2719297 [Mycena olivaceomarginata]
MSYLASYYSYGLPTFLIIIIALYLLFTGSGEAFNVGRFLEETSPFAWGATGIGLAIGLSTLGAGWGIFLTGSSIMGGGVRAPRITTKNLIIGIIFSSRLVSVSEVDLYTRENYFTGFALFWGGLTVGACNLMCGVCVGITGATAALADAADPHALLGLLMVSNAKDFKAADVQAIVASAASIVSPLVH